MNERPLRAVLAYLRRVAGPPDAGAPTDTDLLGRWVEAHDESAFELLLYRHAPMVAGVCRRLLSRSQDVDDATQATFLALVRGARSIGRCEAVGAWLFRVAYRMAARIRADAGRQRTGIAQVLDLPARETPDEVAWRDLRPVLDQEIDVLPAKLRAAFVLCFLGGRSNEEAASELGCPVGTVQSRMSRARERLRLRLTRRGLAPAVGALVTLASTDSASAILAPTAATVTSPTALTSAWQAGAGGPSSPWVFLVEEVLKSMNAATVKVTAIALLGGLAVCGTGAGFLVHWSVARDVPAASSRPGEVGVEAETPGAAAVADYAAQKRTGRQAAAVNAADLADAFAKDPDKAMRDFTPKAAGPPLLITGRVTRTVDGKALLTNQTAAVRLYVTVNDKKVRIGDLVDATVGTLRYEKATAEGKPIGGLQPPFLLVESKTVAIYPEASGGRIRVK